MANSKPGSRGATLPIELDKALDDFERSSGNVGAQTITAQGAYRRLTDALAGSGADVDQARATFLIETAILGQMHGQWLRTALALNAEVTTEFEPIVHRPSRCTQCGAAETASDRWNQPTACNNCIGDAQPDYMGPGEGMGALRPQPVVEVLRGCECDGEVGCSSPLCDAKASRRVDPEPTLRDIARGTTGNGGGR